jgi:hypothetical protein
MPIAMHTIWLIYVEVTIPQIIVVFCIIYPSFTLLFVVFHPSRCFFISFEILNEAKVIHHYINDYSCRIDLALNVILLKSILLMIVYYFFYFNCLFKCKYLKLGLLVIRVSTIHFMGHLFSNLRNSYGVQGMEFRHGIVLWWFQFDHPISLSTFYFRSHNIWL